jgi:uracil-DNA glycosylase family 4
MLEKPEVLCSGCPIYEPPYGKHTGYVPASGSGENGVLIVLEAAGEHEEREGVPVVGKAGYSMFQQLARHDIERDGFLIHNVLSCRPPDNKFDLPYIPLAIQQCSPLLDGTIEKLRAVARQNGKTPVVVTLGVHAFKRILGLDAKKDAELLKLDYWSYPFWADKYGVWVIAAPHPAYLVRGNTELWPVLVYAVQRALEIANHGLHLDEPDYLLDPNPTGFSEWIKGYELSLLANPDNPLSYDIETPYKKKVGDEDEVGKDEDADHTILRISFSYLGPDSLTHSVSIKWSTEYLSGIEKLFLIARYVLGWNNNKYDDPRVTRFIEIHGISLDAMVAWHILNTSLPKSLGFVTPYYWQNCLMWKHLSEKEPAFYSAKDADAALRNFMGIKKDLIRNNLWHVYERHWIELSKATRYMSKIGVLRDNEMRDKAEADLTILLNDIETRMEEAVPVDARKLKIYKKAPKSIDGLLELQREFPVKYCGTCALQKPKRWKKHAVLCGGAEIEIKEIFKVWGKPLEFKVSKLGMTNYQKVFKHQAIFDRKAKKTTFNADAITLLMRKYPNDRLYPRILEHRKTQKLLTNYVGVTLPNGTLQGGMPIGRDGRIHTQYGRDASTLRFTSETPNLQNCPRPNPKDPNDPVNIIRNLIIASPGCELGATDFAGIESVLVGYFAAYPEYIRLALHDVHTYLTVYGIYETEGSTRIKASDLPELSWPDDRLFPYLAQLKKQFSQERNKLYKHIGHAFNFGQSPKGTQAKVFSETGVEYPLRTLQNLQDIYFSLFPKIKQWQKAVTEGAEKDGYLRNPFDYVSRFSKVFDYSKELGEWTKKAGPDWNKVIAYKPQSTAVGIITESILELYFNRFEEAGQYLRLQIHDELLYEAPVEKLDNVQHIVETVMGQPIPQLPIPESWGLGPNLAIKTESKRGFKWGEMS